MVRPGRSGANEKGPLVIDERALSSSAAPRGAAAFHAHGAAQPPTPGMYCLLVSLPQNVLAFAWFTTRPGPGRPAALLMPGLVVGGMQNTAAPTGVDGS